MINNPNAEWENCDYLLWPVWYAWVAWGLLLSAFAFGAWCVFVEGL